MLQMAPYSAELVGPWHSQYPGIITIGPNLSRTRELIEAE